jgi:hypothetical protein
MKMGLGHSPVLDITSLQLLLDSANSKSYAGSGTTWSDLSGNGRNFTLVNGPYENYGYLGSMYFDGADDYATSSYAPVFTGDFTISFWVNFKTYINYQNVISSAANGNATYGFWLEFGSARGFTIYSGLTGTNALVLEDNVVSITALSTNTWHHICVTRSGSGTNNIKLYVDNVLCGQNTYTATIGVATQNLMLAKYSYDAGNTSLFNGYLSNLTIQHSAVTSETIAKNYAAGRGRFDNFYSAPIDATSLVLNLDAGNPSSYSGSGTTWTSLTGTNNATLQNGPTFDTANGGTILFDGTNDYASCVSSSDFAFGTGDFTLEVWIKHGTSGNSYTHMLALPDQNTFALKAFDNGTIGQIYFYTPSYSPSIPYATVNDWVLDRNVWNHIVFVRSSAAAYGYKNAVLKGSATGFNNNFTAQTLNISWGFGSEYRSKNIAVARIWKRALSQAEITSSFNALRGRFGL